MKLSSQGTYNLGNKSVIVADYVYEKVCRFAMLGINSWLQDDNILHQF